MFDLPINTARTRMRPIGPDDASAVHAVLGDRATTADVSFGQPDEASTAGWVERRVTQQQEHGYSMWAVELTATDEIVGLCGFFPRDATTVELGYVIRADNWGQGLAPEVASAAVDSAVAAGFSVVATIRTTNTRSLAVAHRIGLTPDGAITDDRGTLLVYTRSSPQGDRTHP